MTRDGDDSKRTPGGLTLHISRRALAVTGGMAAAVILVAAAFGVGRLTATHRTSHANAAASHKRSTVRATHSKTRFAPASTSTPPATTSTTAPAPTTTSAPPATVAPLPLFTAGSYSGREPSTIDLSGGCCAVVQHISWTSWTTAQAVGTGTYEYDTCAQGCVQGPFDPYPARITLSAPLAEQFTVLTLSITGGPDAGVTTWQYPSQWPFDSS